MCVAIGQGTEGAPVGGPPLFTFWGDGKLLKLIWVARGVFPRGGLGVPWSRSRRRLDAQCTFDIIVYVKVCQSSAFRWRAIRSAFERPPRVLERRVSDRAVRV